MTYSEQKAREIWGVFADGNADKDWLAAKIKEVIRDTRHKCAENIVNIQCPQTADGWINAAHSAALNTNLD